MAFTPAELIELRRFAGYPVSGAPTTVEAIAFEAALAGASSDVESYIRDTVLPRLRTADEAAVSAISTIDTKRAAVWERNPNALAEGDAALYGLRRDLVGLFGLDLGPFALAGAPALPAAFMV